MAHIHTDSLGSIQSLKAQHQQGNYKKKRKAQNKGLTTAILKELEEREICMVLEWVKGHEPMKQETHTWISRMKVEGNEMADVAAKQAATDQIQDDDYPFEHSITFRHKESGVR